jgi:hypothetical protein
LDRVEADVLIVGDFRFPGGTSTAVAAEVRALTDAGYRVALIACGVAFLSGWRDIHPEIADLLAAGAAELVAPGRRVRARLACFHHPSVFQTYPADPLLIETGQAVLVVHHPPVDAVGTPQYDIRAIRTVLGTIAGIDVAWAPVGPKVRAAFHGLAHAPHLAPQDWTGVVDADVWGGARPGPLGAEPVVGRHSRPEPEKWPDTREDFVAVYPDADDIRVRLMGYGPKLDDIVGPRPRRWDVLPFGHEPVREFLRSIDYFVYFHGSTWIEAFGRSIVEAMAAGAVCILPPDFAPLFGEGAVYRAPADVAATIRAFHADPARYAAQSEQAVAFVRERFSPQVAVARVRARIGPPTPGKGDRAAPALGRAHLAPRILYFTSNGVGMGHLTRVLALARRHRDAAEPVVVSMSRAFGVVRDEGMMVEHIPFFRSAGMAPEIWHPNLAEELSEMLRFYRARVLVLDANVPYDGLLSALDDFPAVRRVWLRRAMWSPGAGRRFLDHEERFDAVVEPGEIAGAFDRGLTRHHRGRTLTAPPMRFLREGEALGRAAARAVLGLDPGRPAVILQLGAGLNYGIAGVRAQILDKLRTDVAGGPPQIVLARWSIADDGPEPDGATVLRTFPFARFLAAFDYAVAMAGYNTFHENLAAGLPTLFLSNEHPEQDEQWLRADYARIAGLALAARARNPHDLSRGLDAIGTPETQARLRAACARLPADNGADDVARFLAHMAHTHWPHPAVHGVSGR